MSSEAEDDPWKRRERELQALNKKVSDILYDDDDDDGGGAAAPRAKTRAAPAVESDSSSDSSSDSDSVSSLPPAKRAKGDANAGASGAAGRSTAEDVARATLSSSSSSSAAAAAVERATRGRSPARGRSPKVAAVARGGGRGGRGAAAGKGRAAVARVVTVAIDSDSDSDDERGAGAAQHADPAVQARFDAMKRKLDSCSTPTAPVVLDAAESEEEEEEDDELELAPRAGRVTSDDLVAKYRARGGGAAAAQVAAAQRAAAELDELESGVLLKFRANKDMVQELGLDKGAEMTQLRVPPGEALGAAFARLCGTWLKGTPRGSVTFTLDGEVLADSATPEDADMEDETLVDVTKPKPKPAGRR